MSTDFQLHHGDNLVTLRTMQSESVDACICDPPYELSFMSKGWDSTGVAYSVELWREVLRVLKPGGFLLAFGGTRTYHRMACAIEDAGFEIRDSIQWLYGSGFPKSLDISKALDKTVDDPKTWKVFSREYAAAVAKSPYSHADIDRLLGIKASSCYWARTDHRGGMPPRHHWERVSALLSLPERLGKLYDEVYEGAEREVIGKRAGGFVPGGNSVFGEFAGDDRITAPATDAAKLWQGWGTALKPAHEPIVVARKPCAGTVAENVVRHGTGGLNIDACRVETSETDPNRRVNVSIETAGSIGGNGVYSGGARSTKPPGLSHAAGRWPANVLLSHDPNCNDHCVASCPVRVLGEQSGESKSAAGGKAGPTGFHAGGTGADRGGHADSGTAARFFPQFRYDAEDFAGFLYCAKASKKDRGAGNAHPTVKPVALMRWLVELVTVPGGVVLDHFLGSGTTGVACKRSGRSFIGIEQERESFETAERRINGEPLPELPLFEAQLDAEAQRLQQLANDLQFHFPGV